MSGDLAAAGAETGDFEQTGQADHGNGGDGSSDQEGPVCDGQFRPGQRFRPGFTDAHPGYQQQQAVDCDHDSQHGQDEEEGQMPGLAAGPVLMLEKVQEPAPASASGNNGTMVRSIQKLTFGTSRLAGSSISSNSAALNANQPATKLLGNDSRKVL